MPSPPDTSAHESLIRRLSDLPDPYWCEFDVEEGDIDGFHHVNNTVYLRWLDNTVWQHTRDVGLDEETCLSLDRGMAAIKHEINYLASARKGERIAALNWLVQNDGRLRARRQFQIISLTNEITLVRAVSDYVCTKLTTGKPARMPSIFKERYAILPSVQHRLEIPDD